MISCYRGPLWPPCGRCLDPPPRPNDYRIGLPSAIAARQIAPLAATRLAHAQRHGGHQLRSALLRDWEGGIEGGAGTHSTRRSRLRECGQRRATNASLDRDESMFSGQGRRMRHLAIRWRTGRPRPKVRLEPEPSHPRSLERKLGGQVNSDQSGQQDVSRHTRILRRLSMNLAS